MSDWNLDLSYLTHLLRQWAEGEGGLTPEQTARLLAFLQSQRH
jgi:hypothetical protein